MRARFPVEGPDRDVDSYVFRGLLALHRRAPGNGPETVTVDLGHWHARDLATGARLPGTGRQTLTLDPIVPVFLELGR